MLRRRLAFLLTGLIAVTAVSSAAAARSPQGDPRLAASPVLAPAAPWNQAESVPLSGLQPVGPGAGPTLLFDADGDGILDQLNRQMAAADRHQALDVIVRLREGSPVPAAVDLPDATVKNRWRRAINGYAAALTPSEIEALVRDPQVARVEPDLPVHLFLESATRWTGVQEARRDFGLTGDLDGNPRGYTRDDVVVAVIDTGIDARHVDLNGGKVIGWHDVVNKLPVAYDDQGHGTHVSSIIAGTGEGDGKSVGVAPGAALVGIKVMDLLGRGSISNILSGIEWLLENKERFNIRVANLSLGAIGCSDGTDALSVAVDRAVDAGITMMVAAGNSGPGACTIGAPAAAHKVISVGAAYDPGHGGWLLAEFSSRGPTKDGRVKPDIITPGYNINAAKANSSNKYVAQSGTSMATPFAAGIVALMLAANPGLDPAGVQQALFQPRNFQDFGREGPDPEFGRGFVKAYDVLQPLTGKRGTFSDGLKHAHFEGDLGYMGHAQTWEFKVTDARKPVAVGLTNLGWQPVKLGMGLPAFELLVLDPAGKEVGKSRKWSRQEQVLIAPKRRGTYTIQVKSFFGDGPYMIDVSYR